MKMRTCAPRIDRPYAFIIIPLNNKIPGISPFSNQNVIPDRHSRKDLMMAYENNNAPVSDPTEIEVQLIRVQLINPVNPFAGAGFVDKVPSSGCPIYYFTEPMNSPEGCTSLKTMLHFLMESDLIGTTQKQFHHFMGRDINLQILKVNRNFIQIYRQYSASVSNVEPKQSPDKKFLQVQKKVLIVFVTSKTLHKQYLDNEFHDKCHFNRA